jgi:hypothetical protein
MMINSVECDDRNLTVILVDARVVSVPIALYPRLATATPEQRSRFEIIAAGEGIRWPEIDEDLSVAGLIADAARLASI